MVEILRENWEYILYEHTGSFYLFIVNGQGSLSDVTYKLSYREAEDFRERGCSFLKEKVRLIRCELRQVSRLHYSSF